MHKAEGTWQYQLTYPLTAEITVSRRRNYSLEPQLYTLHTPGHIRFRARARLSTNFIPRIFIVTFPNTTQPARYARIKVPLHRCLQISTQTRKRHDPLRECGRATARKAQRQAARPPGVHTLRQERMDLRFFRVVLLVLDDGGFVETDGDGGRGGVQRELDAAESL